MIDDLINKVHCMDALALLKALPAGSGTVAIVARELGCQFIGSELNPEYVAIANKRLAVPYTPDMFIMQEIAQSKEE